MKIEGKFIIELNPQEANALAYELNEVLEFQVRGKYYHLEKFLIELANASNKD